MNPEVSLGVTGDQGRTHSVPEDARVEVVEAGDAEQGEGAVELGAEELEGGVDAGLAVGGEAVEPGPADEAGAGP